MTQTQHLPPRFPCWCRATFSWGGETKKDLGFVEGDLIECLNAGDGLWWMGRLRRDPRMIGLFPSNFVKVLDQAYQPPPNSRSVSPMITPATSPAKSRSTFRKPFQAYEEAGKRDGAEGREGTPESDKEKARKNKSRFMPYNSMKTAQAPSGTIKISGGSPLKPEPSVVPAPPPRRGRGHHSRPASPNPAAHGFRENATPTPTYQSPSRAPSQLSYRAVSPQPEYRPESRQHFYRAASPQPQISARASPVPSRSGSPLPSSFHDGSAYPQLMPSREPSPAPYQHQNQYQRPPLATPMNGYYGDAGALSPPPSDDDDDAPPPPPPAHTVAYQPSRAPSPQPFADYQRDRGSITPVPPSPAGSHMTPSPLRDAMNDVMSSLETMSIHQSRQGTPSRPITPGGEVWSPEAFEVVRRNSQIEHQRAQSSLGFVPQGQYHGYDDEAIQTSPPSSRDGPPVLDTFVERMERRLRHEKSFSLSHSTIQYNDHPPAPPLKGSQHASRIESRPSTSASQSNGAFSQEQIDGTRPPLQQPSLRHRKSAFELRRTQTTKTNTTDTSAVTQSSSSTNRSLMSGYSAGGFSATSAGSLARKRFNLGSQKNKHGRGLTLHDSRSALDVVSSTRSVAASESSGSGPSYHSSHGSSNQLKHRFTPATSWTDLSDPQPSPEAQQGIFGGLSSPKAKKSGFFKKMIDSARTTARTGAANARSTIGTATSRPGSRSGSPTKVNSFAPGSSAGMVGFGGGSYGRPASAASSAARDMGLGGDNNWMQSRRDVNRSNSISQREHDERRDRCEMLDLPAIRPIDEMHETIEGDEGLDGLPLSDPCDFNTPNLALVDKSTRFVNGLPPMVSAASLAQSYVCRPHRSDVQRLRAIFTWVAERIAWEEDFEGQVDSRRVISSKRGCSEEIAVLVRDMCSAVGLHCEVVRGYLKTPGESLDLDTLARPNHWWNAVIVDGEWRILDCALASPSHPKRAQYSAVPSSAAENWYFLARPTQICYTHVALLPEQQHIVPPVAHEVLCALPCAAPTYFRHGVELADFDTSSLYLENLEMAQFHVYVPEDIECIAETEARAFAHDADGDLFESGDMVKKRALAQPQWVGGRKRYTFKALLPSDEGQGTLKVYAGKRGLMHSIKDNPHGLAFALPLSHTGQNPPYEFFAKHPTPHAQRHDLYVAQPQCAKLVPNMTYVFCVRQHPSSLSRFTPDTWGSGGGNNNGGISRPASPAGGGNSVPFVRPGSAMSMISTTTSLQGSNYSDGSDGKSSGGGGGMTPAQLKPAKLAIQTPGQKIIRLTRKMDHTSRGAAAVDDSGLTTEWETVIKVSERGTWRGLVLADRSARWCVFAEWECV